MTPRGTWLAVDGNTFNICWYACWDDTLNRLRREVSYSHGSADVEEGVVYCVFGCEGGENEKLCRGWDGVQSKKMEGEKGGHSGLIVVSWKTSWSYHFP